MKQIVQTAYLMPAKKSFILAACCVAAMALQAQVIDPKQAAKDGATDHVNNNVSNGVNNSLDKAENSIKGLFKKKNKTAKDSSSNSIQKPTDAIAQQVSKNNAPPLKVYANYDFVPGDKILFADDFSDDQDGEFPAHWELASGQGLINKIGGIPAFLLTEGNYVKVVPRLKTKSYLTDPFTIECDYYLKDGSGYGVNVFLECKDETEKIISFNTQGNVSSGYFEKDFSADYPNKEATGDNYFGKWHHVALIYKNQQIKCYVDQYRVLVMPNTNIIPVSVEFGGIGSQESPIVFKNVRIASGGEMNMIGKKFTETKIVTHGINFDIDKADIRPESMGTLNMIVQVMKDNPDLKFEVDGHTDNSGTPAHNLSLSQQRADAVKDQLVKMGIDAARLGSKGFGDSKPISDNSSPEGKANNRRVEFVKM